MTDNDNALAVYEPPAREMTRLKAAFSKDLTTVESIKEFATICRYYDLDPFIGEIVPMHGRIYVEEAGWLRHIQQKAPGELVEYNAGPCDKAERETYQIVDGDWLAWGKVVRRYPNGEVFTVRELATLTKAEIEEAKQKGGYTPVAKEPWRMAMKRARVRALRIAFREVLHVDAFAAGDVPIEVEAQVEAEPPLDAKPLPAAPAPVSDTPTAADDRPTPPSAAQRERPPFPQGQTKANPREMVCEHADKEMVAKAYKDAEDMGAEVAVCTCCGGPTKTGTDRCKWCRPSE